MANFEVVRNPFLYVFLHIVAWTAYISFPLVFFLPQSPGVSDHDLNNYVLGTLLSGLIFIAFFYFNYFIAIPRFFFERKYWTWALLMLIALFVTGAGMMGLRSLYPHPVQGYHGLTLPLVGSILFRYIPTLLVSLAVRMYQRWKRTEEEKITTELAFLKAQINPHFLFNTLNGIYSLAVRKSEKTPEALLRLSGMMRYVVSELHHDFVPLEKELAYLDGYIELQQLRLTPNVTVNYQVKGTATGKKIAPLIFISFVENVYKYGTSTEEPCEIFIHVDIDEKELHLKTTNRIVRKKPSPGEGNGLGIGNTRRRLLLLYPGQHHLEIRHNPDHYVVQLDLRLK